ncbi:hypothetical protein FPZ43_03360 [Mucilaginibacter pallidiroseus]|uniref:Uncharacterized protein n=1 Tax=Mucilaginibacter pallidiroseus TaxID=2599295 RepID=A0A563UJH1_9SPHI|nr:hypothetical protein [Mucilaginibacter pallidiroseus]TWR31524.1 hypothetical protein FPZ43_03360 [Mucilaginibacter pallidiroseus]
MTDLNEYECEMLDALLQAFGVPDSLTRLQIMDLFDQDEATAFAMVQALMREGFITSSGKHGNYELPELLILKPKGEKFLKDGGFTKRYQLEQQKTVVVGGTLAKLQQQNMKLQNEKLSNKSRIADLQKELSKMQIRVYLVAGAAILLFIAGIIIGRWL